MFHILLSFLLIISSFIPVQAQAEGTHQANDFQRMEQQNTELIKGKLSEKVRKSFKDQDMVSFLVKFKEKADTEKAVKKMQQRSSKQKMGQANELFLQRSAVVSELKRTAKKEQHKVISYLQQEEKKGNAATIKSFFIVNGVAVTATKDVAETIASFPEVELILPNEKIKLPETETKLLTESDDLIEWNVDRVGAPNVWKEGINGSGVVVATIDSGVDWKHPALKSKYRGYHPADGTVDHRYSWYDATANQSEPYDDIGHGTHVTGTMVGSENDGSNQIGVAPGAKWIAVKAFSETGGSDANLLRAAEWILAPTDKDGNMRVDMAPDIVNNSWAGNPGLDEWYRDVVKAWIAAGIFPVFSAGNTDLFNPGGDGSIPDPANYPESFATGAIDKDNQVAGFSLRGPSPYEDIKPDIAAPGVEIRSAIPGGDYGKKNGTSMASPAVAGAIALLTQFDSGKSIQEMKELMKNTATKLIDDEYKESPNNGYGHGLINIYNAVESLQGGLGKLEGTIVQAESAKPLVGAVTVKETNRSTKAEPADGSFTLIHPVGDFTVEATAYGHFTNQQAISFEKEASATAKFVLTEIPKGIITGTITDRATNEVITNATVQLVEDANIPEVQSDGKGKYELEAYEGRYTLMVTAPGYHDQSVEITIDQKGKTVDVKLDPFYTYPGGELGYDNGKVDNGSMYFAGGVGWAVRMSLPEGKKSAVVTDGVFHFIDKGYSESPQTEFAVEVWDAKGNNGLPGNKLAGPIKAEAQLDDWTVVDLREHNIKVDGDFYMVYVQTLDYPDALGLATDNGNPYYKRSYQYLDGMFYPAFVEDGNYMIRARVDYGMEKPEITSPRTGEKSADPAVTIVGKASPTATIELTNNGVVVGKEKVNETGTFEFDVELSIGDNEFIAVSTVEGQVTDKSDPITVHREKLTTKYLKPSKDEFLISGDTLTVGFHGNLRGAEAYFSVKLPNNKIVVNQVEMKETLPGYYKGHWQIPDQLDIRDGMIEITYTNGKDETLTEQTNGRLFVYPEKVNRIAGDIRYDTAVEISKEGWYNAEKVILSRGDNYADALAGVPLSKKLDAPILLTPNNKLWKNTEKEIKRLGAKEVIILGGEQAISNGVEKSLQNAGVKIQRIYGKDRFETASKIAKKVVTNETNKVAVVNGMDFPDALSVATYAAQEGIPILLAKHDWISQETLKTIKQLGIEESLVVGGTSVIGTGIEKQLPKVTRLAGHDRYETNIEVAKYSKLEAKQLYVATGKEYADALSGAVLAAKKDSAILLVHDRVPKVVSDYLELNEVKNLTLLGGIQAISKKVENTLAKLVN